MNEYLDRVVQGDCLEVLRRLPDCSVDSVITDPPYAEVKRDYGRWTEQEWWALIVEGVIPEVRRILKPTGSAVFIVQPNSRKVGSMRGWVFEFMAWVCREWNMVQDCYWWNMVVAPTVHCQRAHGLMRPSVKPCIWCGDSDCYRNQDDVLWSISDTTRAGDLSDRALRSTPSGQVMRQGRCCQTAIERNGSTPFNLVPLANSNSTDSAGSNGHGAGTPLPLARWWTRYICPPGGVVLDPFMGAGTMALAAIAEGRHFIGIERCQEYVDICETRIAAALRNKQPTLALEAAE